MRRRLPFIGIFVICASLLGFGYFLEFARGLTPCPLCIVQRVCFMLVGLLALLGAAHGPASLGTRIYAGLLAAVSAVGAAIAGRQIWLQHLPPDKVPECGPDLAFMLEMYAPIEILQRVLKGTGECAEIAWTFLGLTIPGWSLLFFAMFICVAALLTWRPLRWSRTE